MAESERKVYWILSHHQSPYSGYGRLVGKFYKGIDEEAMEEILRTKYKK